MRQHERKIGSEVLVGLFALLELLVMGSDGPGVARYVDGPTLGGVGEAVGLEADDRMRDGSRHPGVGWRGAARYRSEVQR
ncbi:MAG TPA: hypothetical protein VNG12_05075 [Acidimicrobiales bacterium]|nr:hypothetical protein [Acidimicrobiales bacterium]